MTYGMKIPIGNLAQVPSQRARILEIDCTGEWYARHSFEIQLIDAMGNVLARNVGDRNSNDSVSSCSATEIDNVNSYPAATDILIPNPSPVLLGYQVSGPGVSLRVSFVRIAPADYCDSGAMRIPMFCRSAVGDVYFPPAG